MELWFTEKANDHVGLTCKVKQTLMRKQSPYQEIMVIETEQFGRMLLLDGVLQTTTSDEFVYHEMISHVPLNTHPNPRRVAVIGGGDGGTIREIIKHDSVEKAVLVEIDEQVIEASRQYLPEIASGLDDERVEILITDGITHIQQSKNTYDVIIVDSTDPVGPAVGLFTQEFYGHVFEALTEDGIMVAQTESPYYEPQLVQRTLGAIGGNFPITRLYLAYIPTYPSGMWSFTLGSKTWEPQEISGDRKQALQTRYYTPAVHAAAFCLPAFVEEIVATV
ncbi:MAG: polyamine aminopropyltransferase [Firmicutes bacterium]|nr:polyamine aminopropyltransferase [Bacillota bacterium]